MTRDDQPGTRLAAFAALLADSTRASFCLALLDGRAWTAGELARHAGVAPSTTTAHLTRLVDGGVLTEERQGRHRYVKLADPQTAQLIEALAAHALPDTAPPRSLRVASANAAMARARTCYDHLAGRLGIAVTDAMTTRDLLRQDTGFALTDAGVEWFSATGIALVPSSPSRRPLAKACLDWTERRPHLAGTAGAELCRHFMESKWCVRIGSQRALKVTEEGTAALEELLGIRAADLEVR